MKKPPKKLPKLWQREPGGPWWVTIKGKRVSTRTKDGEKARARRLEAMRGKTQFEDDLEGAAEGLIAALESAPGTPPGDGVPPAPEFPPPAPAAPLPLLEPDGYVPPPAGNTDGLADDLAGAAGAAGTDDAPPPPPKRPKISDEKLAEYAVKAQVLIATTYAQRKAWKDFKAPPLDDAGKAVLSEPWKELFEYCGVVEVLPAWVTGLVFPSIAIIGSTAAMAHMFAELAAEQKKAAGVVDDKSAQPAAAAA